jgi:asparagine N-glycosylation enzyme membrane subunit Stt3
MTALRTRFALPLILVLVALCSLAARELLRARVQLPRGGDWVTFDNDSFYHMRRVARVFDEGLPVAETDPRLDHPAGARIPWPPYYTLMLAAALAPFAPQDAEQRRGFIERGVGNSALVFGVLGSLLAAGIGWKLARAPGALFAGLYHALCYGSISYSRSGIGDHHAFVAFLAAALLASLALGLGAGALERPARAWGYGVLAGLLAGLALGAWVGSLMYLLQVEFLLAILLFFHARRDLPGLVPLGLGFHLAAAAVSLPAVLSSPWRETTPWIVVNLSWFHTTFLLIGACVFAALARLAPGGFARRRYPWLVACALLLMGTLLLLFDAAPARGVREGFAWVSRADAFMSGIQESRPLLGEGARGLGQTFRYLGYGSLLLPVAWLALCQQAWRRGRLELLPWIVSLPPLALQALRQVRFTDALSVPLAIGLTAALALLLPLGAGKLGKTGATVGAAIAALLLVCLAQLPTLRALESVARMDSQARAVSLREPIAQRMMLNWIRRRTPADGDYCVLADWTHGHGIEWAADRPSVATNFGTYTAEEGFFDAARFFLTEDFEGAEELLTRRRARYVYLTSSYPASLRHSVPVLYPEGPNPFVENMDEGRGFGPFQPRLTARWLRTMGARLMNSGRVFGAHEPPVDFLRLVHVSPAVDPEPRMKEFHARSPMGWIWEHVPGARVSVAAPPGTRFSLRIDLSYGPAAIPHTFEAATVAGKDGVARLRVPYTTDETNGDGRVQGGAHFELGGRREALSVPESAVLAGAEVWIAP